MDLLGTLGKAVGGGKTPSLLTVLLPLLQQQGGLPGLVKLFEGAGLGNLIQSWIGTGQNLPISASQISQIFGGAGGLLGAVSKETGLAPDDAAGQLSKVLPGLVDSVSPDGTLPTGDLGALAQKALASGVLGKLFG